VAEEIEVAQPLLTGRRSSSSSRSSGGGGRGRTGTRTSTLSLLCCQVEEVDVVIVTTGSGGASSASTSRYSTLGSGWASGLTLPGGGALWLLEILRNTLDGPVS